MSDYDDALKALLPELLPDWQDGGEIRRAEAINKLEASLIASADAFVFARLTNRQPTPQQQRVQPGTLVVAHETLLLLPVYPASKLDVRRAAHEAALIFPNRESREAVVVLGTVSVLEAAYHLDRFPGAGKVLSIAVKDVRQVVSHFVEPMSPAAPPPPAQSVSKLDPTPDSKGDMRIVSINVSMPSSIEHKDGVVVSGIFKRPVDGPVSVRFLNLEGDGQADLWAHGGSFRAIYVYPAEHYDYWTAELQRDNLEPAQFGENLTVLGMLEDDIRVGDRFRVGSAVVEVSQPRVPCFKLAIRMGIENFQARFLKEGRLGFYLRVLQEGQVSAGDRFELLGRDPQGMSVRAVSDLLYFDVDNLDGTRQALAISALSHGWKTSFEERLQEASRSGFREFVVTRKVPEAESITSFYLEPRDRDPLSPFKPGQFLTFRLNVPGSDETLLRTYSLSDSPHCPYFRVSIKREPPPRSEPDAPPGLSSNYFHDHVQEGSILEVGAPRGDFVIGDNPGRTLVLLSAGVGITPLLSMLTTVAGTGQKVWFVHGARNGREHAFGEHVRRLAEEHDNVSVHIAYSAPDESDLEGRDYHSEGRVNVDLLKQLLPFDDYAFYMVGPPPFMRGLFSDLCAMGIDEGRIHYEFFGPAATLHDTPAKPPVHADTGDEGTEVVFASSGVTATWKRKGTLLDLAESAGITPAFSCRAGICRTCQCRVIEGEVVYDEEPLANPASGEALICVGKPGGRVVLDL